MPSNKWVCSIAPRLPEPVDALDLTDARYLAIVTDADGLAALPAVREPDGLLRRAGPGNGVAEALLALLARTYRLLVFAGSEGEAQLAEWTTARGSTVIGVGGNVKAAQYNLRYPGDADDTVRLLTEVLVPELIAARAWQGQRM